MAQLLEGSVIKKAGGDELIATENQLPGLATTSKDGLLSSTDKAKLDDIGLATTSKDGLLSSTDKAKLDTLYKVSVVESLPASPDSDTIYYVLEEE